MTPRERARTLAAKAESLWYVWAIIALVAGAFGFRAYTPSERIAAVEAHQREQDSTIARHQRDELDRADRTDRKLDAAIRRLDLSLLLQCPGAREITAKALCEQVRNPLAP